MSNQRTLQQLRAAQAWQDVESVAGSSQKEYASLVRSLPALIQSDGLATSLAFLCAKGKTHHEAVYKHLGKWVLKELDAEGDFIQWLIHENTGSFKYRQATTETLAYLTWLKRFAEAKDSES